MLTFFPAPYEDELLYSLLARYARLTGYSNLKSNLHDLFGRKTVTAIADLPTHLDALAERLVPLGGMSSDEIIDRHTLLLYYAAFHPPERREKVREAMRGDGYPHGLLGLMAARGPVLKALHYCPACANQERRRFGEAYWHRSHQLSGVLVCTTHKVWLEKSEIILPAPVKRHAFVAAELEIPYDGVARPLLSGRDTNLFLELARRAQALLTSPPIEVDPVALRTRYVNALAERQLATFSGRLRIEVLQQAITTFCPEELRDRLSVPPIDSWLLRLLRKPRTAAHTLYHLLVQAFLELDHDALEVPIKFFGEGPWPCLNRAAAHYSEQRIIHVQIDYTSNAREPIGTFACSCGFSYRRVGPDRTPEDAFRIDRMVAFGPVWSRVLEQGWNAPDLSLRGLARQLGVDPRTVNKQAAALDLPSERLNSRAKSMLSGARYEVDKLNLEQVTARRDTWLRARKEWPNASIKKLREQIPGDYIWLYRNDKAWLDHNKPTRRLPKSGVSRVDWKQRDAELTQRLRAAAQELLAEAKPVRVTRSRLGRMIGHPGVLENHLNKLPKCKRVLSELIESREAFALRRIDRASLHLHHSGERVQRWQFARLCGLRSELLEKSKVATAFERAWTDLEQRFELSAA